MIAKPPTLEDVAQAAGVSAATISRPSARAGAGAGGGRGGPSGAEPAMTEPEARTHFIACEERESR